MTPNLLLNQGPNPALQWIAAQPLNSYVRAKMKRFSYILIFAFLSVAGCGKSRDISLNERYPGPWKEDFNMGITKILASNNISGCGEYKYRESNYDKGEYLVYCTSNGKNWTSYLVWENIAKVTGPHTPDSSLQ